MSTWFDAKREDISRSSVDDDELDIYIRQDYSGAVYVSVKIQDVLDAIGGVHNP